MKKSTENEEKKQTISDNRKKVLSWLEGLTFDDWHMYHSDSEVQNIAKEAFELLKEQEAVEPMIKTSHDGKGSWWYICGSCNTAVNPKDKYCRECGMELKWE